MQTIETTQQFEKFHHFKLHPFIQIGAANTSVWPFSTRFNQPHAESVRETFEYLFDHFKKGIYVRIAARQLEAFIPFDNKYYTNNWYTKVDLSAVQPAPDVQEYRHWYANNYLVRYERPFNRGENGLHELKDLFESLCANYHVPDVEFFVNKRDFPLLTENNTEPYRAIHGENVPCAQPQKPALVLSMVGAPNFSDVPIPTPDDWSRATRQVFSHTKRAQKLGSFDDSAFVRDWAAKQNRIVFRGSNTGPQFGEARIRLCELGAADPRCDFKLTALADRPQVVAGTLQFPPKDRALPFLGSFLSLTEQTSYRYILHMAGHVQSYRLGAEFATYSTLLIVASDTKLWFEDQLVAWKHFVPIAADLSDLREKIDWCFDHSRECEQIARDARAFYEHALSDRAQLEYMYQLLCRYREVMSPMGYSCRESVDSRQITKLCQWQPPASAVTTFHKHRSFLTILEKRKQRSIYVMARDNLAQEAAVGIYCVNPLVAEIPNFLYTFGFDARGLCVEELTTQLTLADYIRGQGFRWVTYISLLKQLALSLAHAQTRCFYSHGRVSTADIMLTQTALQSFDYIVMENITEISVWRFRAETYVPIWTNYSRASGISNDGVVGKRKAEFAPFLDCLWILMKSAADVLRFHGECLARLHTLFGAIFEGSDGQFYAGGEETNFRSFISEASADEHLLGADKGNILGWSPMKLFRAVGDDPRFKQVAGVEYTHFGKVGAAKITLPARMLPLWERYHMQRAALIVREPRSVPQPSIEGWLHGWRIKTRVFEGRRLHPRYHEPMNRLISMLADGTIFSLSALEKEELMAKIKEALFLRAEWRKMIF